MNDSKKVLLIVPPWAAVTAGALGVSTLKAILQRDGIEADVKYINIQLSRIIGLDLYNFFSDRSGGRYRGEIFFTPYCFDHPVDRFVGKNLPAYFEALYEFLDERVGKRKRASYEDFLEVSRKLCSHQVPQFLDQLMEDVEWNSYDIIGFSLMFAQTLGAVAVARRIKQAFPDKLIVFGGPSCDDEMGAEMCRTFDCVDVVVRGEADHVITPLVRALRAGDTLEEIPGLAFHRDGEVVETQIGPLLTDLDWLPIPDYEEYARATDDLPDFARSLYFETSRGCWWGQKEHCTFCGLNANGMAFRRKSPERAIEEIIALNNRFSNRTLFATDNILDMTYFKTVLPELAQENRRRRDQERFSIFYETKSNLRKDQMILMKDAGIDSCQPGIESFSDNVLKLMRKGATGIQQIQFVKWATELGIGVEYGVLYNNAGERPEDYDEMGEIVDFICHLQPPRYITPIALDRFSPYYRDPDRYGIRDVQPDRGFRLAFTDCHNLSKLAYRFTYDYEGQDDPRLLAALERCIERIKSWRDDHQSNLLTYDIQDQTVCILDNRHGSNALVKLDLQQTKVFLALDGIRTLQGLSRSFPSVDIGQLRSFLDLLVGRRWAYRDRDDRYVALPVKRRMRLTRKRQAPRWATGDPAPSQVSATAPAE